MRHGRRKEGGRLKENVREMRVGGGRDGEDERTRVLGEHPTPKTCVSKPSFSLNINRNMCLIIGFEFGSKLGSKYPKNQ